MNDNISNGTSISVEISELTRIAYNDYVTALVECTALSLLFYTTALAIPQDMVYMWLSPKRFSIPSLLYGITRYAGVLEQATNFLLIFTTPDSLCNILLNTHDALLVLGYVGVQGLLIVRGYSLCQGNKVVTAVLALSFGGGFAVICRNIIIPGGCLKSSDPGTNMALLLTSIENICVVVTDLVVFGICLWKVWGIWKLKRETGIQSRNDLVSVILEQTLSRFSFVILLTPALIIVAQFRNGMAVAIIGGVQRSLSSILLADFMLDLRQQNSAAIQAANISLPTIQIRSIANYIHQSILVEMGDHETSVHTRTEENDDLSAESSRVDVGIGREESA